MFLNDSIPKLKLLGSSFLQHALLQTPLTQPLPSPLLSASKWVVVFWFFSLSPYLFPLLFSSFLPLLTHLRPCLFWITLWLSISEDLISEEGGCKLLKPPPHPRSPTCRQTSLYYMSLGGIWRSYATSDIYTLL